MVTELCGVQFRKGIKLSGLKFGLKSDAWFQHQKSAQHLFVHKQLVVVKLPNCPEKRCDLEKKNCAIRE